MNKEEARQYEKVRHQRYYKLNRERINNNHKEYRENNKEKEKERHRLYYLKNKDRIDKRNKEYAENNQDRLKAYHKRWNEGNKGKISLQKKKYHSEKQQTFISLFKEGKSCEICGYNKYPEILQFHHKNRSNKSFSITRRRKIKDLSLLKAEIDKCDLICPNCHAWLHYCEGKEKYN